MPQVRQPAQPGQQQPQQQEKKDPTVRTLKGAAPEYPEGTHPPNPPDEQTWGPGRFTYSDMPEEQKPDKSTVANVIDSDPVTDKAQEALREGAEDAAKPKREDQAQQA